MKIRQKSALFFIFILIAAVFPVYTAKAEELPKETDASIPAEAPMFDARIEYTSQGYLVRGTFTEFPSDISLVQPLYSLDGEIYEPCGVNWDLYWLGGNENELERLHHQICLYSNQEPLKSYLAKNLDRFYLKLRLTRENGTSYETQAALIERGGPQPIPEGSTPFAKFDSSMFVREFRPFCCYGRYQLTVSENASPEDISAFLPDTLPIEIQLQSEKGIPYFTNGVVNCPVTWKPLSLPRLTAGESITLMDAAEEIAVPGGTLFTTPTGIFQLNEPLNVEMDEVRLVLNVIAEGENPTGALTAENTGLEMTFHLKPTGATAIRAYTLSKGGTEWTEIPGLSLLDAVNAQPSTANSGYTLVLDNTCEPYQSYLAAVDTGENPEPFFVGLKIEGGAYDGRQLVLAWPDTYELPVDLPDIGGSGGNEDNAGADNKDDSTEEGQRPNLPENPDTQPNPPQDSDTKPDLPENPDTRPNPSDGDHFDSAKWKKREGYHIPNRFYTSAPPLPITRTVPKTDAVGETSLTAAFAKTAKNDTHTPAGILIQETFPEDPLSSALVLSDDDGGQTDRSETELPKRGIKKDGHSPSLLTIVFIIVIAAAAICITIFPRGLTVKHFFDRVHKKDSNHRNP